MEIHEQRALEDYRHRLALQLEEAKAAQALFAERTIGIQRAVFEYAQIAIRSIILANGITATAILAYLGDASGNGAAEQLELGLAATVAAVGVAFGVTASFFAYLSQWAHLQEEYETGRSVKPGSRRGRSWGIFCLFGGLVAFLVSIGLAVMAYS